MMKAWFAMALQWEVSLRDLWEISPGEWRGFKLPSVPCIPPPKVVERIGYADRLPPPLKYFDHADAHLKKHKKEWGRWEKYSSDVADRLRTAEPHYPEFSYLKVKRALFEGSIFLHNPTSAGKYSSRELMFLPFAGVW